MDRPADTLPACVAQPAATLPEEAPREEAGGPALEWVARYMPAYGTSTLLHVAAGMIAWFLSMQVAAAPAGEHFKYTSAAVPEKVVKVENRKTLAKMDKKTTATDARSKNQTDPLGDNGRGVYKTAGNSFLKDIFANAKFGVVAGPQAPPEVFGIGGGGGVIGGIPGLGAGRGGGIFERSEIEGDGPAKIVYIVDRSGSMTDSLDIVKYELKRSLGDLEESDEFHVIFFSSGPPVEMPTRRLVNATERNKIMAFEFIDGVVAQSETDPSKALERAFACKPDTIYLLTDGEFDRQIIDLVTRLDAGGATKVNTIGFLYTSGEEVLKEIANKTGGSYKLITEKDLDTIIRGH